MDRLTNLVHIQELYREAIESTIHRKRYTTNGTDIVRQLQRVRGGNWTDDRWSKNCGVVSWQTGIR